MQRNSMKPLLTVEGVSLSFGGVQALQHISLSVAEGQIVGLIGPNGAGKTTLFNCISRYYTPSSGRILLRGEDLLKRKRHQITGLGIGRTFQRAEVDLHKSAFHNILVGAHRATSYSTVDAFLHTPGFKKSEREAAERVIRIIELLELTDYASRPAHELPFPLQKKVDIGRALATGPMLLLLDEPAAGMNRRESDEMKDLILRLVRDLALTVVLVEHDMKIVTDLCDLVYVLNYGEVLAQGSPAEVMRDKAVQEAYLGMGVKPA